MKTDNKVLINMGSDNATVVEKKTKKLVTITDRYRTVNVRKFMVVTELYSVTMVLGNSTSHIVDFPLFADSSKLVETIVTLSDKTVSNNEFIEELQRYEASMDFKYDLRGRI